MSKVLWEQKSNLFFLHTKFFFSYCPGPREVSKSKFASVRSKIFPYDSLKTKKFCWVKTPMGMQWFEVDFRAIFFVFVAKFTKIDLALKKVIQNRSKAVQGLSVMFWTIWLKNFLCVKSHMGTALDSIFFTYNFFISYSPGPR